MANILTVPESGIFFDGNTAGSAIVPILTGNASGVAIKYNGYAGVEINSSANGINYLDRFSVDGSNGRLFGVTDEVTGIIFSVNDAAGLPIIEVESVSGYDKITIGEYGTNALVVSGSNVGIGTITPSAKLEVNGDTMLSGGLTTLGKTTLSSSSFVTQTGSFTLGATHKGATVLLQNSAPINITVPAQTSGNGYVATFIAETQNLVSFVTGVGMSGLNSFNGASDIAGIFGQAQIIYKSSSGAFLGGNIV